MNTPKHVLRLALILVLVAGEINAEETDPTMQDYGDVPSAFFDTLSSVMTGDWTGKYTNGTFENPTEWMPIRVEYRLTSRGTALVEDYIYGTDDSYLGMTTVYHKDNNELRLTHYCGAMNHPSMIARHVNPDERTANFEFTGITNHTVPTDYHSRAIELDIVDDDNIHITYHGTKSGKVYSQAYDLTRYGSDDKAVVSEENRS